MDYGQKSRHTLVKAAFGFTLLLNAVAPTVAEENTQPMMEKWRPKNGPYASPSAGFDERCLDFGDVVIDLADKTTGGSEEKCKIVKLRDTAPGAIALDLTCVGVERETPHKEVMLLKKIDDKTIFVRETQDGKFKYPGAQVSFCGDEVQRTYIQQKAKK